MQVPEQTMCHVKLPGGMGFAAEARKAEGPNAAGEQRAKCQAQSGAAAQAAAARRGTEGRRGERRATRRGARRASRRGPRRANPTGLIRQRPRRSLPPRTSISAAKPSLAARSCARSIETNDSAWAAIGGSDYPHGRRRERSELASARARSRRTGQRPRLI